VDPAGAERRTYTGWKAALLAIGITVVVFSIVNVLAHAHQPKPRHPKPSPTVISVTPRVP
jgi:hypothetical protein